MATHTQSYPVFSGRAHHALDGKNRTTIPSGWRPDAPLPLWLVPHSDGTCLLALPLEEFRAVPDKVNALTHLDAEDRQHFIDNFFSSAEEVTPDSQGRFVIPPQFCEQLRLKGEVVFAGANKQFKIYAPAVFEQIDTQRRAHTRSIGKQVQL
jgi:MraZ protein